MATNKENVCNYKVESEERWHHHWRHLAAYVFLIICLFDFIVMPIMYETINKRIDRVEAVELSLKYTDAANRATALTQFSEIRTWKPLTLQGGGMFFMAFGAILGAAAWTRGQEKIHKVKNGNA